MASLQTLGRYTGGLMLAQLLFGMVGPYVVLTPVTAAPGFLDNAAALAGPMRLAVLALVIGGLVPVLLAAVAWPVWRQRCPTLGLGLLILAGAHLALQLVENAHWLSLLAFSEAYQQAGAGATEGYSLAALGLRLAFRWIHYAHILLLVLWMLLLFAALGAGRLIPRGLALLGMGASLLHLGAIPLAEQLGLRLANPAPWALPAAAIYLAVAGWLLWRGFAAADDHANSAQ